MVASTTPGTVPPTLTVAHPHSRLSRLIWSATTLSCSGTSGPAAASLALPFRAAISRMCWTKMSVKRRLCRISVCSCWGSTDAWLQPAWLPRPHPSAYSQPSPHLHEGLLREVRSLEGHSPLQVGSDGVGKAAAVAGGGQLRRSLTAGPGHKVASGGASRAHCGERCVRGLAMLLHLAPTQPRALPWPAPTPRFKTRWSVICSATSCSHVRAKRMGPQTVSDWVLDYPPTTCQCLGRLDARRGGEGRVVACQHVRT